MSCERSRFPFTTAEPEWSELCLSVAAGVKLRVIRRGASTAEWCIAQTEDGRVGLLPSVVVERFPGAVFQLRGAEEAKPDGTTPLPSPQKSEVAAGMSHDDGDMVEELLERQKRRQRSASSRAADLQNFSRAPLGAKVSHIDISKYPIEVQNHPDFGRLIAEVEGALKECDYHESIIADIDAAVKNKLEQSEASKKIEEEELAGLKSSLEAMKKKLTITTKQEISGRKVIGLLEKELQSPSNPREYELHAPAGNGSSPYLGDVNGQLSPSKLLQCELDTLTSYMQQELQLQQKSERIDLLQRQLADESTALQVSETSLGEHVRQPEGEDYTVDPKSGPASSPLVVTMRQGFEWPRTLAGLTPDESDTLSNYVRLYDKYCEKRLRYEWKPESAKEEDAPEAYPRYQKLQCLVTAGDADVKHMEEELEKLQAYIDKYKPIGQHIEEQIDIGSRVLDQKRKQLEQRQA